MRDGHTIHTLVSTMSSNSRLWDMSKVLNIVSLYWPTSGMQSRQIVSDVVGRLMDSNAKHDKQLTDVVSGVENMFQTMRQKFSLMEDENVPLNHQLQPHMIKTMDETQLESTMSRVTEVAVSLTCLLESYPPACNVFHQLRLQHTFISFYGLLFPFLQHQCDHLVQQQQQQQQDLKSFARVNQLMKLLLTGRSYVVHCVRQIIVHSSIRPLFDPAWVSHLLSL